MLEGIAAQNNTKAVFRTILGRDLQGRSLPLRSQGEVAHSLFPSRPMRF